MHQVSLNSTMAEELSEVTWGDYCVSATNADNKLTGMFLYSLETQTTIGYGSRAITRNCPMAIFALMCQYIYGNLLNAFTFGYILAKVARPTNRINTLRFSKNACISLKDGKLTLMIRVGNLRKGFLANSEMKMLYVTEEETKEKETLALVEKNMNLDLGGSEDASLLLMTPQIVCHTIDENSPLYHLSQKKLYQLQNNQYANPHENFEILVFLSGNDEASGNSLTAKVSYSVNEVIWGQKFDHLLQIYQKSGYEVDFSKFDKMVGCGQTNELSAFDRDECLVGYEKEVEEKRKENLR